VTDDRYFLCQECHRINRVSSDKLGRVLACGRCRKSIVQDGSPVDVTDDVLTSLISKSPVPVLIDFWAPWCGPCRAFAPMLETFSNRHAGRLIVAKVNTEEHQRNAALLGVRAIPTLALYKGGQLQHVQPGAQTQNQLEDFVGPYLSFVS